MDPISALALAGNIIRFLEFGFKIVTKASNIHDAGSGVEYTHLEIVTTDLQGHIEKLRSGLDTLEANDVGFRELCDVCSDVAAEMLQALQALLLPGKPSRWKSFRQALKSILGKERIVELTRRLEVFSSQMDRRLLMLIREQVDVTVIKQKENYHRLDQSIQTAIERIEQLEKRGEESAKAVQNLGKEILGTIKNFTADNKECHDETHHAIAKLSNTFQQDSAEMVMLATDCIERFKSACEESQQYQQQALTVFEQGRVEGKKQIDELKQEIQILKQAIGQSLQQIRNNEMSSEEQRRVKDTNNALYNLCVAKELVLRNITHLKNHIGDWVLVLETVSRRINFLSWHQPRVCSPTELDNWGTNSEMVVEVSGLPEHTEISPFPDKEILQSASSLSGHWTKLNGGQRIMEHDNLEARSDLSPRFNKRSINPSHSESWALVEYTSYGATCDMATPDTSYGATPMATPVQGPQPMANSWGLRIPQHQMPPDGPVPRSVLQVDAYIPVGNPAPQPTMNMEVPPVERHWRAAHSMPASQALRVRKLPNFILIDMQMSCYRCKGRGIRCILDLHSPRSCLACQNAAGENQSHELCDIRQSYGLRFI